MPNDQMHIPLSEERYASLFITTKWNQLFYHLTNFLIIPLFLLLCYSLAGNLLNWNTQQRSVAFLIAFGLVGALHWLDHKSTNYYWQRVSSARLIIVFLCLLLLIYWRERENYPLLILVFWVSAWSELFLLRIYRNSAERRKHWSIDGLLILLVAMFILLGYIRSQMNFSMAIEQGLRLPIEITTVVLLIIGLFLLESLYPIHSQFLSHLHVRRRVLTRNIRHDRIRMLISQKRYSENAWNRLHHQLLQTLKIHNHSLYVPIIIILGFVVFPSLAIILDIATKNTKPSSLTLLTIALLGSVTSFFTYWLYYQLKTRQKYIIVPFKVESESGTELLAIANLTTNALSNELQRIGQLLTLRQIENATSTVSDDAYALFVTSGQEQEFIRQIQSLTNLEVNTANIRFPVGSILSSLVYSLADIRVRGTLQRRQNNTVEIWVELTVRNRQTVAADTIFVPENSISDLDEVTIGRLARQLAIRLIVELRDIHLASTAEGLDHFLQGLDASSQQDWWQAIAFYRRAIQIEEAVQGNFGIGHYHLGVALIFQGDYEYGLRHLRLAESNGPPLAETQYMLALVMLYQYWDLLHLPRYEAAFKNLEHYCLNALKLRYNFPEAHHLLGVIYYRRGRLREREATQQYEPASKPLGKYHLDYRKAMQYLRGAIHQYDKRTARIAPEYQLAERKQIELQRAIRNRMTAAHQLADSLRALHFYAEADTYYEDVLVAFPRNIRTLVDLAKTYCTAGNWQQADESLRWRIFKLEEARWNPDVHFFMGWTLAGGIAHRSTGLKFWLLRARPRAVQEATLKEYAQALGRAMWHLDFALHQQPAYWARWQQNNWLDPFLDAVKRLEKRQPPPSFKNFLEEKMGRPNSSISYLQMRYWLAWRAEGYWSGESDKLRETMPNLFDKVAKQESEWCNRFRELAAHRHAVSNLIAEDEINRDLSDLQRTWKSLQLAQELYTFWRTVYTEYEMLFQAENAYQFTFIERWAADIFAETALLTTRLLARGRAYEHVYQVAFETSEQIEKWRKKWLERYHGKYHFSHLVFRFQLATLHAWTGYAIYQCCFDDATQLRYKHVHRLDETERELQHTFQHTQIHPLALYVKALLLRQQKLLSLASVELNHLLKIVAPFDPLKYVVNWDRQKKRHPGEEPVSIRTHLDYMARVNGYRQFEDVIDESRIHSLLSDIFFEMGAANSGVQHLLATIKSLPSDYFDENIFLNLAYRLNLLERFDEAQAVLESIRLPRQLPLVSPFQNPYEIDIAHSIVSSRQGKFGHAFRNTQAIARTFRIRPPTHPSFQSLKQTDERRNNGSQIANDDQQKLGHLVAGVVKYLIDFAKKFHVEVEKAICEGQERRLEKIRSYEVLDHYLRNKRGATFSRCEGKPLILSDGIPRIFEQLRTDEQNDNLSTALTLATYRLMIAGKPQRYPHLGAGTDELKADFSGRLQFDAANVIRSQILLAFLDESLHQVERLAEICNTLAYSKAELDVRLDWAYEDACFAILLAGYLADLIQNELDPTRYRMYREYLAQFHDTMGWIHYRAANHFVNLSPANGVGSTMIAEEPNITPPAAPQENGGSGITHPPLSPNVALLSKAQEILEQGLKYDPQKAIIHYHLARIHLTKLENLWQQQSDKQEAMTAQISPQIDMLLRKCYRHWRSAKEFDEVKRFHSRLIWLRKRNEDYQQAWHQRELRLFRGEIEKQKSVDD